MGLMGFMGFIEVYGDLWEFMGIYGVCGDSGMARVGQPMGFGNGQGGTARGIWLPSEECQALEWIPRELGTFLTLPELPECLEPRDREGFWGIPSQSGGSRIPLNSSGLPLHLLEPMDSGKATPGV